MFENYARVNGINLHYVEEGVGDLVILLHGFPDFWYGWRNQIPALAKKFRVVAPDMRGYNLSDKPERLGDYRIDILASDIAELIKALGHEKAFVVGHDWGGGVAWALATRYPKLVRKLAVINAPHPNELIRALCMLRLAQLKKSYYIFLFQIPKIPERMIGRNLQKFFGKIFKDDSVAAKYVEAYSKPRALASALNYYREAARTPRSMQLKTKEPLSMPVLLLWGEKDIALGKELTFNTKRYCRDLEILYDPNSGHFLQVENPELVNKKLLEFFI